MREGWRENNTVGAWCEKEIVSLQTSHLQIHIIGRVKGVNSNEVCESFQEALISIQAGSFFPFSSANQC